MMCGHKDLSVSDRLWLSKPQFSDHIGAKLIYPVMLNAKVLIGDKGRDSEELRDTPNADMTKVCIHQDQTGRHQGVTQ